MTFNVDQLNEAEKAMPPIGARVRLDKTGDVGYVRDYAHMESMPSVWVSWEDGTRATAWPDELTVLDPAPEEA